MTVSIKRKKSKYGKLINSNLAFKNGNFKFISQLCKILIKTNKIKNKLYNKEKNKDTNKEKIKSFYRVFDFSDFIILLLISTILSLSYQNSILYEYSAITLKVIGGLNQKIFNGDGQFFTKPDEVWIDGLKKDNVQNNYEISSTQIITLKWTNEIEGCDSMFWGCDKITEINFVYFDAKKCTNTFEMFRGCRSLTSLDLSEFITSSK